MARFAALAVVCVIGVANLALSDEAPTAPDVKELVLKLGDPDAAVRDAAEKKLTAVGKTAIEPVSAAADSPNLEMVARCVAVLAGLRNSADGPTKQAAEAALKKLAESKNRSLARRANAVINPNPQPVEQLQQGFVGGVVKMNVVVNNTRISVTNKNGDKTLTAEEGGQKTEILRKATGEILVKVTKNDDKGKPQTTMVDVNSVDDLKKHPEAFKAYQKYEAMLNGNRLNMRIRAGAVPVGPQGQAIPLQVVPFQVVPGQAINDADKNALKKELETALENLRQATGKLKDLSAKGPVKPEDVQQVIAEIEAVNKQLTESRKKLEP